MIGLAGLHTVPLLGHDLFMLTNKSPKTCLLLTLFLAGFALPLAGCGGEQAARPQPGEIELNSLFTVDFDLIDDTGVPATDERFVGKPMLIYFGFTSCPDVCPAALGKMTAALDRLGSDADKVQPLFITVDPKRDNPERLAQYLGFDERILGLTGSADALQHARDGLKVYAKEVPLPDSAMGYTVDHQRLFYVTDRTGAPVAAIADARTPEEIAALVRAQF